MFDYFYCFSVFLFCGSELFYAFFQSFSKITELKHPAFFKKSGKPKNIEQ